MIVALACCSMLALACVLCICQVGSSGACWCPDHHLQGVQMTSVDTLIASIKSCDEFIGSCIAPSQKDEIMKAMGISVHQEVSTFECVDVSDAAKINKAISESAFSSELKDELSNAVSALAMKASAIITSCFVVM